MAKKQNKEDNRLLLGSVRMPDVSNPSRDEVFKRRSAVSDDWEPSKELLDAIKSYEKFSPVVYKDGNGIETIGYGITDKKIIAKYRGGKRMSKREAERLFNRHVDDVIAQMKDSIPNFSAMSNNQKDAMTSYVYNVGIGGVTRKSPKLMEALENKNWKEAAKQMDFGYNDKNNSGLRRRRDEERALFTVYLDMGLEDPTEEELAAAHARMQQNALEDILSSRNELELQDPLRTKFDEAYRVAMERKQPTFTWNGREYATDLKSDGGPVIKAPYIASRDATSVGQLAPNPNARDITGVYQPTDLTEIVAGGIPVVGDVMDARDLYTSIRDRDAIGALFASVGFLPIVGGAAKSALRMRYSPDVLRKRVTYGFDTPEEAARMMGVTEDNLGNTINLLSENIDNLPDNVSEETVANIRGQVERFKEWAKESNIPAIRESDKAFNLSRPFNPKHPISDQKTFDDDYKNIKNFADKYGYEIPSKSDIKSDLELDDIYQRIIRQHRTFVRGVRANNEEEAIDFLFGLAKEDTGAGRYGIKYLDDIEGTNYVSNSIDQAKGYATGYGYNGENGWIGFMRIGEPLDFTKSLNRKDWLDQAEFDYGIYDDSVSDEILEKRLKNLKSSEEKYIGNVMNFISLRRKPDKNISMPNIDEVNKDISEVNKIRSDFRRKTKSREEASSLISDIFSKYGINDFSDGNIPSRSYMDYLKNFYKTLSNNGFKAGDNIPKPITKEYNDLWERIDNRYYNRIQRLERMILHETPEGFVFINNSLPGFNPHGSKGVVHAGGDPSTDLTHYIVTNRGLITPISYQNIGNLNPEDYTRYHEGIRSMGLSRREYKHGGEKPDGGYVAPRDAIQPPANPTMDFMNLIGESTPYDAGVLPDINVIMDLPPEEYRDAMRKAAARRGRNYVYQAQEEAAPLIQGIAGAAAAASLVSVGLFQPTMNFAADFMSMLENPLDPVNYLPYSDVFKITKKTNSYDEIEKMIKNRKNVKDEYSESVRKFFKNILVPEYERIIERRKDELSENGKKLLESRLNGKNYLDFVEEADKLGINDDEFGDIQKSAMMQLNVDLIKKEIEKPDAFNYNIGWTRKGAMGEYDQYSDEVNLSKIAEAAGFDTKFSILVHEFRHKMDSKGINRKTADDVLRRFSLSENEIKTLEDAYVPAGKTKGSDDLSEIISTNTDLKLRIIKNAPGNRQAHVVLEPEEILGMYNVSEKRFREILDNTSDEDLLDMLESVSDYGMDYASSIRSMKDDSFKKNAINAIRKAVSTIPFSVVSMNQSINLMNDKPVREEDIVQGGDPIDIETANSVVYNSLKDEMRDGGSFSDYLSKVDGDNLIDKLSKTNYYGKKRANLFKLARMGNKEAYNVLIDDFKEKLLEIDRKQNKNSSYEEGGEIDEDLSPNEAILRRIANDLSSRNMLAENAAYYSGQDEITAEELANYIGKMSPHRFVMSIGSDDDELNDFSTRLTTGVLDGDEQAMEDAETLLRMMLETPFNNSNITIMRDGGNILPGLEDVYMTPELLKYEQGGEAVKDRQMYVYKRLKEEAYMDDLQALAVIGNLMGESGLNPYLYGDQDTSYGIQQWRGERRDRLNKLAREKGEETPSFETQVDYLINEYLAKPGKNGFIYNDKGKMGSGYYNYSLRDFQNASTLRDATVAWNLGSGRPHKDYMRNDERYRFAKQAANNLGIELDEPDTNYYSDNGIVQNGFSAPSVSLAQNNTPKEAKEPESSTVKIEEGNIPDRSTSKPSEGMTEFQQNVINELLIQRGLIMGEQARQQEEAEAQRAAEERQARINEEARRNAIIQSVLQNAKLDIPGMASR